jgi:hypothetical protein
MLPGTVLFTRLACIASILALLLNGFVWWPVFFAVILVLTF